MPPSSVRISGSLCAWTAPILTPNVSQLRKPSVLGKSGLLLIPPLREREFTVSSLLPLTVTPVCCSSSQRTCGRQGAGWSCLMQTLPDQTSQAPLSLFSRGLNIGLWRTEHATTVSNSSRTHPWDYARPLQVPAWANSRLLRKIVCFSQNLKIRPLPPGVCGRVGAELQLAPVSHPRWVHTDQPYGFLQFFSSMSLLSLHSPLPLPSSSL